ncbi:hypothetical protein BgiBS90_033648 [Biomphalaria glabrata]|nr:hypothetical protein BgiBS90_033648 [Biomphalaria glabrata]
MAAKDENTDAFLYTDNCGNAITFEEIKHLMSPTLKKDNYEILIINSPEDHEQARRLKKGLESNVSYCKYREQGKPKVELYDEVVFEDETPTYELDFSLSKTLVVFLLATNAFCKSPMSMLLGRASLDSIVKRDNPNRFLYVIHTKPERCRDYVLPTILDSVISIHFSQDGKENVEFYEKVKRLLESKVYIQYQKDVELYEKRCQFVKEASQNNNATHTKASLSTVPKALIHQRIESDCVFKTRDLNQQLIPACAYFDSDDDIDIDRYLPLIPTNASFDSNDDIDYDDMNFDLSILNISSPESSRSRSPTNFI